MTLLKLREGDISKQWMVLGLGHSDITNVLYKCAALHLAVATDAEIGSANFGNLKQ